MKKVVNDPLELYQEAEDAGIGVYWLDLRADQSMAVLLEDGSRAIGLDPWRMETVAQETVSLAHEMGHCCTGSFYNRWAARDVRRKHENRADKWAIRRLIPREEFNAALASGRTEVWDLADFFSVTEDLMHKALCLYTHGNLAVECYAMK